MDVQEKLLDDNLMKLLDPCTTPENALQLFSSPCFSPSVYTKGDDEPAVIFLAYFKFMMTRLPDACVDGIWEDILNKAVMYTRYLYGFQVSLVMQLKPPYMHTSNCAIWLQEALSTHKKCPNPYSRLKLFRIIRMTQRYVTSLNWEPVCAMFIETINEIKPHHLYPSGDKDENVFSVDDLINIIAQKDTIEIISTGTIAQICNKNELFVDSKETRFISHCIQLIGIFVELARSIPDHFHSIYKIELRRCCHAFNDYMGHLITPLLFCKEYKPWRSPREWFQYFVSRPPFRHYAIQTVRILIAIFIDKKVISESEIPSLEYLRDVAGDLGACNKSCELPRLLLYRQIHGSTLARQHTLLIPKMMLKNLSPHYTFVGNADEDDNVQNVISEGDNDYLQDDSDSHEYSDTHEDSDSQEDNDSHNDSHYSHNSLTI
ncbi:unnamed protein product, partial [Meganyctiphanes norvegica]